MTELFPYQQQDLEFFSGWGRSANFSEPGVGKTPVAVKLIQRLEGLPCLIVCPAAVRYHWEKEIQRFWDGPLPVVRQYQGERAERLAMSDADILIVNYELFRKDFDDYFKPRRFQMTVFDEAHRIKNRQAKVTKCAYRLNTEYIHLITGTPITNQFDDVWSYLHLLFPSQFKNYWQFVYRFGIVTDNGFGKEIQGLHPERGKELGRILQQFSIRHTKKEVLPQLPDKIYQTIYVDLTPEQRRIYDELSTFMAADLENDVVEVPNIIAQLTKLRQVTLSTGLIGDNPSKSAKKLALWEILEDRILAKKKTVVMSEFRAWIDELEKDLKAKGVNVVRLTGAENDRKKREAKEAFQEGDADVILCTIKAAGTGIDLTAADMLIFTDISWTDVDNRQAEDRIHRASQTKKVQIVRLFAKDTIDGIILDRTLLKALTAQKILGDMEKQQLKALLQG